MILYYYLYYLIKRNVSEYFARMIVAVFQIFFVISIFRLFILELYGKEKENALFKNGSYTTAFICSAFLIIIITFFIDYDKKGARFKQEWGLQNKTVTIIRFLVTIFILSVPSFFLVSLVNLFRHYW